MTEHPTSCPYCGRRVEFRPTSGSVYGGRNYGPIYVCSRYPDCGVYVGCHKGTNRAKGTLANKQLRQARMRAHRWFDPLWKAKMKQRGWSKSRARQTAYGWLANQMQMSRDDCHIAMLDVQQCDRVRDLCLPYAQRIKELTK